TAALSNAASAAEVVDVALTRGLDAVGARAGAVLELDAGGHALEIVKAVGYEESMLRHFARVDLDADMPVAEAVRRRQPVFLDSPEERTLQYPELARRTPDVAPSSEWVAIPLEVGSRVLGAFVMSLSRGRPISAEDRAFIVALGQQCAQALDRNHSERR